MIFWSLISILSIPVLGQFGRISFGSGGILWLDILLPLFILGWGILMMYKKENPFMRLLAYPLAPFIALFVVICFGSLLYNAFWFSSLSSFIEGVFYAIRYASILVFSIIIYDTFKQQSFGQYHQYGIYFLGSIATILALLGLLQLWQYPDFAKMAEQGWDPHIGRLLSTWFDPNFLGSFFSFVLILLISVVTLTWKEEIKTIFDISKWVQKKQNSLLLGMIFVLLVALLLTYSRSALLAFLIPVTFLGILYFRTFFIFSVVVIGLLLPFSDRAMQRISDGVSSAFSLAQEQSLFMPDATARLRVENFQEGLSLGNNHFFTGIGFNVIRQYKTENIHSAGGFDSSLLTVFVTTGIFGLFIFLLLHFYAFRVVLYHIMHSSAAWQKGFGIGLLVNFFGVFAQSFFINSLFFPFFILYFWGCIAFFLSMKKG